MIYDMILHYDKHLHIDEQDPIVDQLVRCMKSVQRGTINLDIGSQQVVKIDIINNGDKIMVNLLETCIFQYGQCLALPCVAVWLTLSERYRFRVSV